MTRVSIGQGHTYGDDGNVDVFRDAPAIPSQPFAETDRPTAAQSESAISQDGSRVFFTSTAGLVPQAQRGVRSVYEYREGDVYLVSDGQDASRVGGNGGEPTVQLLGIDPLGQDAFFLTADRLVPQDAESQAALYDAREGGGFPAPTVSPGCAGETCRGPSAATPQMPSPASAAQPGGGNLAPPPPAVPGPKPKPKAKRCRKGFVRKKNRCVRSRPGKHEKKAGKSNDGRRAGR